METPTKPLTGLRITRVASLCGQPKAGQGQRWHNEMIKEFLNMMVDPMNAAGVSRGSRSTLGLNNRKTERGERMSRDTLNELRCEHAAREIKRLKLRLPIIAATIGIAAICLVPGVILFLRNGNTVAFAVSVGVAVAASVLWNMSAQLLAEWDRAVVLRMGRLSESLAPVSS